MKIKFRFVAVIMIALMSSVVTTASAQAKEARAKTALEAEFRAMVAQYYTAWSTLNPDNAAKYYAKDADIVFYDVAPLKYNSWAEYRAGVIKAFTEPMASGKLLRMMIKGDSARNCRVDNSDLSSVSQAKGRRRYGD